MTTRLGRGGLVLAAVLLVLATALVVVLGRTPPPERHELAIRAWAYEPATLEARAGDTLVWTNHDVVPHTATVDDGSLDSGVILPGASWSFVVPDVGHLAYICSFHPPMKGAVTVR